AGVIGKTTAEMQMQSTFTDAGWDFTNEIANGTSQIWQMPTGGGYPVLSIFDGYTPVPLNGDGTEASPYLINDSAELGAICHYNSNACFRLQSDIDLTGIQWSTAILPTFAGCFDGNGYVIYNLNIDGGGWLGLFGKISGSSAEIKNLGLENINITGGTSYRLGGLCGYNYYGTITNCYVTGSVTGGGYLGGLCGSNNCGTISNCYAASSVTGGSDSHALGGLCGFNTGTIISCYAAGSVIGGDDSGYLGGLCGYNYYGGTITNCYTTGSVNSGMGMGSWYLGGLCGRNSGTVTNCYTTGSVTGGDSSDYLGGLCGKNYYGTITNCYATGSVTGDGFLGGLCGYHYKGTITNCFWDVETSGMTDGVGNQDPDPAGVIGKTTAQMQTESTFTDANWDFTVVPVWHMPFEAIGYPMLGWQKDIPGDFTGRYGVYMDDFAVLSNAWLSDDSPTVNWNEHCDL
ncbi:MAG: hypothetical protein KAT56_06600, partial [Sedimentisphaerales bacterium]|nr:hypothetical protein [Sedimentisphaerales bacterium]